MFNVTPDENVIRAKLTYRQCLSDNGLTDMVQFVIPSVYASYPVNKHWCLNTTSSSITVNLLASGNIRTFVSPTHEITPVISGNLRKACCRMTFIKVPIEVCRL